MDCLERTFNLCNARHTNARFNNWWSTDFVWFSYRRRLFVCHKLSSFWGTKILVSCKSSKKFKNCINHSIISRYIIPKEENIKLERLAKKMARKIKCDKYIRHKTLMIPPAILKKNNIKFGRVCIFFYTNSLFYRVKVHYLFSKSGHPKSWRLHHHRPRSLSFGFQLWIECSWIHKFWDCGVVWRVW